MSRPTLRRHRSPVLRFGNVTRRRRHVEGERRRGVRQRVRERQSQAVGLDVDREYSGPRRDIPGEKRPLKGVDRVPLLGFRPEASV